MSLELEIFSFCKSLLKLILVDFLKLVRIMLETSNLALKYIQICSFKNIPFSIKVFLVLLMLAFFLQKVRFFSKNNTFNQSNSLRALLEIF